MMTFMVLMTFMTYGVDCAYGDYDALCGRSVVEKEVREGIYGHGTKSFTLSFLTHQDERNPVMPLSSADCQVPIDQTPRNKRCPVTVDEDPGPPITSIPTGGSLQKKRGPKTKSHGWSKKGHGGHQRREFKCQGWQSGGPSSSDSPI